jgi:hypothetical protein
MIDIRIFRENPEKVREAIKNKGIKNLDFNKILEIDAKRSSLLKEVEELRNQRNKVSDEISKVNVLSGFDKSTERRLYESLTYVDLTGNRPVQNCQRSWPRKASNKTSALIAVGFTLAPNSRSPRCCAGRLHLAWF